MVITQVPKVFDGARSLGILQLFHGVEGHSAIHQPPGTSSGLASVGCLFVANGIAAWTP